MSGKGKILSQFASLAFMTQGILLLNQIILLPIQLHVWQKDLTAYWFSILAIAAVTNVADFGLRSAGHAQLMRWTNDPNDHEAANEFQELWAWIRILIVLVTSVLVIGDFVFHHFCLSEDYPLWRTALLLAVAMEVVLGVRINYLDTQGFYREAEGGFLILIAARLILTIGALVFFHASPAMVAWIWFGVGAFALLQQGWLCRRAGRMKLFEAIPSSISWRTLGTIRYTMADPCSNWVRINGPVVVLGAISAPSIAIVTYVALRAIFGAARSTILQISRYASVEYLALRQAGKLQLAEMHFTMMMLMSAFFASGMAAFVILDNGRLASLVLKEMNLPIYQMMAITFALGNAFFSFAIPAAVSRRAGEVVEVAYRQYFYILCAAVFAAIALVTKSMLIWLLLAMVADVLAALSFMVTPARNSILQETTSGWRAAVAAATSSVMVLLMWLFMQVQGFNFLDGRTPYDILCTIAFFLGWILVIGFVDLSLVYGIRARDLNLPGAVFNWAYRVRPQVAK